MEDRCSKWRGTDCSGGGGEQKGENCCDLPARKASAVDWWKVDVQSAQGQAALVGEGERTVMTYWRKRHQLSAGGGQTLSVSRDRLQWWEKRVEGRELP